MNIRKALLLVLLIVIVSAFTITTLAAGAITPTPISPAGYIGVKRNHTNTDWVFLIDENANWVKFGFYDPSGDPSYSITYNINTNPKIVCVDYATGIDQCTLDNEPVTSFEYGVWSWGVVTYDDEGEGWSEWSSAAYFVLTA